MTPLMFVAIAVAVPALLLIVLRVNAALVFLTLCLGSVLEGLVGTDAHNFVSLFSANRTFSVSFVSLVLLLAPAVFTTVVMIGTARGKFRMLFNILPALSVGIVGLMLAKPLLSHSMITSIDSLSMWREITRAQSLIVGVSALVSLLSLWMQRPKRFGEEGHRRHHRR